MPERPDDRYPQVDTEPSEHERAVSREEETGGSGDATVDEGRRPTSREDLAADQAGDDHDRSSA